MSLLELNGESARKPTAEWIEEKRKLGETAGEYLAGEKKENEKAEMFVQYVLDKTDFFDEDLKSIEGKSTEEIINSDFSDEKTGPLVGKRSEKDSVEDEIGRIAFRKAAQMAVTELVTHGKMEKNKNGKYVLKPFSDLDGKMCIGLFRMAGFTKETKVKYVAPGGEIKGAVNVDTSGKGVERVDKTMYIDHHANDSKNDTSASEEVYDILFRCGLLEPSMALEGAVEFVTHMDNGTYPGMHEAINFENSYNNLIGLSRFVGFEELMNFFENPVRDPLKPLTDNELDGWPLSQSVKLRVRSDELKERVMTSIEEVKKMEDEGWSIETNNKNRYGRVLIDVNNRVPLGKDAALAGGYDTYIGWNPEENGFVIHSRNKITDKFGPGFVVREHMWLKTRGSEPIGFGLGELLGKMGVEETSLGEGLKKYLEAERNKKGVEPALTMEQIWAMADKEVPEEDELGKKLGEGNGTQGKAAEKGAKEESGFSLNDILRWASEIENENKNNEEPKGEKEPEAQSLTWGDFEELVNKSLDAEENHEEAEEELEQAPEVVVPTDGAEVVTDTKRWLEKQETNNPIDRSIEATQRVDVRHQREEEQELIEEETQRVEEEARLLEEARKKQVETVMQLRQELVEEKANEKAKEEREFNFKNVVSGVFFARAWNDVKNWWKKLNR